MMLCFYYYLRVKSLQVKDKRLVDVIILMTRPEAAHPIQRHIDER